MDGRDLFRLNVLMTHVSSFVYPAIRYIWRAALVVGIFSVLPGLSAPPLSAQVAEEDGIVWTDASSLTIDGRGWDDVASPFDRLPARAERVVRPEVWALSRDSTGLYVEFQTDSPLLRARWSVTRERIGMPHMPATGVSGLDLYVWDERENRWRWLANGRPTAFPANTVTLVNNLPPAERRYRLYLPLYNGVTSLEIGARGPLRNKGPDGRKPVVIYGTSITQGASARALGWLIPRCSAGSSDAR
jgi:hypothetical protein